MPLPRTLAFLFPTQERRSLADTFGRGAAVLLIAAFSWHYLFVPLRELGQDPGWMHRVHLVFHEAGHVLASMLSSSRVFVVFMGSGMQVLFPLVIAAAFYFKNADEVGAALGLWWTGHALLDVAPYIADARALELVLISGGTGRETEGHDWEFLLSHWHALPLDLSIAGYVACAGRVLMVAALAWAIAGVIYDRYALRGAAR